MPKEHVDHAEIRGRLDELAEAAQVATDPNEPIDELIARIRLAYEEDLLEYEQQITDKQNEFDDIEAEYDDALAPDEAVDACNPGAEHQSSKSSPATEQS